MFARTVRMHLKPNSVTQFTQTMERDVIPLLRKQPGTAPSAIVPCLVGLGLPAGLRSSEGVHFIVANPRRDVAVSGAPVHGSFDN